jgi:subtilisin family serine protease
MADLSLAVGQARKRTGRIACAALLLALTACGGGGGSGSAAPPAPPIASASSNVSQGQAPLTVNFDASRSSDPQSFPLTYAWNFGDGTSATGVTVAHVYQNHGSYTATVAVGDGHNTASATPIAIAVTPAPPTVQPTALPVNVMGVAPTTATATISATDRESLPLTYSIVAQPTAGTATINSSTGAISYVVAGYTSATTDSFTVKVGNLAASATGTVSVALNGDPLLPNQWHIQNTGQNAYSTTFPVAGNDMNVTGAWTAGYSGKGIKVGVVDSGLEAAHEDLAANVDLTHSWNFVTATNDPTPTAPGFDHGTSVSGIIGAVAFNGVGGRGVAYNATLRGYNLLAPSAFSVAHMAKAMGSDPVSADNDLFNASFSTTVVANSLPTFSQAFQAITSTAMGLRGGLGSSIVNAAGNDFEDFEGDSSPLCAQFAQTFGVSCGDPASDERRGGDFPIIVGAINAAGVHSSYSNTGSSLWISAPGGEYGWDTALTTNLTPYTYAAPFVGQPAIITTNIDKCTNAAIATPVNLLNDLGANPLAANCQYTATMNGTSAATPNVSGVVALMLEANPKLSVRDIKYILAKSAKHVDANFAGVASTNIIPGNTVTLEQGWVTNGGGFAFSNRYGFGAIDAAAAVGAAKTYSTYLPAVQNSKNYPFLVAPPATIPAMTTTGGFLTFTVSETFPTVEFVVVYINMDATPGLPCNQIELTSPSGTKSILLHAANGFTNTAIVNSRFESNAFYGESVNGSWNLRFLDWCGIAGSPTVLSTTQNQVLLIAGH